MMTGHTFIVFETNRSKKGMGRGAGGHTIFRILKCDDLTELKMLKLLLFSAELRDISNQ